MTQGGIAILLATFNGERFLRQQIDSILGQTYPGWSLVIRDDGSTDGTRDIIAEYVRRYPERISLVEDNDHLGPCRSFSRLLAQAAASDYCMFCDQDDVWLPDKVARTREAMARLESQLGKDAPILVHTDLKVADEGLNITAGSLWKVQKTDPVAGSGLNKLLARNIATGSTIMLNRALRGLALPIPAEAIMHDWWLSLVTAAFGSFGWVPEPTMLYRQHRDNTIGAAGTGFFAEILSVITPAGRKETREQSLRLAERYRSQARAFQQRFGTRLSTDQAALLDVFIRLDGMPVLLRKYYILKYGLFYRNPLITLGMLLFKWT